MKTRESRMVQFIAHTVLIIMSLIVVLPFLLLIIASFTDNAWATANGFSFFPKEWSLEAYQYIWTQKSMIGRAYIMTFVVTAVGTGLSLMITTLLGYAVSQDQIPAMKVLNFMVVFTMLFHGGLVSTYYTYVRLLHIRNTFWAMVVPRLMLSAFNTILVRNYFKNSIPSSLTEAARIDGAGEFRIFAQIVMPLSKPIVATIGLMIGLAYWNDWQNGLYYLSPRGGAKYYTIQVVLNNINENIRALAQSGTMAEMSVKMPSTTIRMAIATVGILPILIIYPFFQKYFVKGITLGGVKE